MVAAAVASLSSLFAALAEIHGGVINNNSLLILCISGSIGGSLVSIMFWPPKVPSIRLLATKFIASGITAILFAPWLVRYIEPNPNAELVLAVSGTLGLCAFAVVTFIRREVVRRIEKVLGKSDAGNEQ
jgi:hypothetical protein